MKSVLIGNTVIQLVTSRKTMKLQNNPGKKKLSKRKSGFSDGLKRLGFLNLK